jgi:metal-sulfur cluster biosynthetic enzyme
MTPVEQAKDFCERMTSQPMACEIMEQLVDEIERLRERILDLEVQLDLMENGTP